MKDFLKLLGREGNLIGARFSDWKLKNVVLHVFKPGDVDLNSLVKSGCRVYLLPRKHLFIKVIFANYYTYKEVKRQIKSYFNPGR